MRSIAHSGLAAVIAICAGVAVCAPAQVHAQTASFKVIDPAGASLIAPAAKLETLKNEFFGFVEGPVWVPEGTDGYLLFSDIPCNCIYKWQNGKLSVFLEKSGFTGTDTSGSGAELNNGRLQVIILGSNGLTLDTQGRLLIAQHGDRKVMRREKDGTMSVVADRFEGKRFNSPNDVVVKSDGAIYFTDPMFGLRKLDADPAKELPDHGVYLVKDGKITKLEKDPQGAPPNGIAFSPNEKILYLTAARKLVAYDVRSDDTIANPRVIFDYGTYTKDDGQFDGIRVDAKGNIWGVGPGGIWAISPAGKPLAQVLTPEGPANLAFGDTDGKGLYITAKRGLYKIRVEVAGAKSTKK